MGISWTMAHHRVVIRRVLTLINAALPGSLQWVLYREFHRADSMNCNANSLAVLKWPKPLVIRPARDEVTVVQGHDRRRELNELGHSMFHVVGEVVVPQLFIIPKLHVEIVRILDFVCSRDRRSDRTEGVERLSEPTPLFPGRTTLATR